MATHPDRGSWAGTALGAALVVVVVGIVLTTSRPRVADAPPAEPGGQAAPAETAILTAARTVIAQARYATMVTMDAMGEPNARIVDAFAPEEDFTVWVATHRRTRKLVQLAANPRVTLLYFDRANSHYVTLVGTAIVVTDPSEKARRWKDDWADFYQDRNRGDDYVLIRIVPSRLEVVAGSLGMPSDPATWRPTIHEWPGR
jgi:general stress protein 26